MTSELLHLFGFQCCPYCMINPFIFNSRVLPRLLNCQEIRKTVRHFLLVQSFQNFPYLIYTMPFCFGALSKAKLNRNCLSRQVMQICILLVPSTVALNYYLCEIGKFLHPRIQNISYCTQSFRREKQLDEKYKKTIEPNACQKLIFLTLYLT